MNSRFGGLLRGFLKAGFAILPASAPLYIYTRLLSFPPLRAVANQILKKIIPESVALPEGRLFLNQEDAVVSAALALGSYEGYFADVLRGELKQGMTMLDIGANLGYYTLITSGHAARVVAFEPESRNIALLKKTVQENNLQNVSLIEKGLSDKEEQRTFFVHPDNKGKHSLLPTDKGTSTITITLTTLDAALLALQIKKVDLIKIDVEGWEPMALRGAKETIRTSHPTIMLEYAPNRIKEGGEDPERMLRELAEEGYYFELIDEEGKMLVPLPIPVPHSFPKLDDFINIIARVSKK